MLGTCLFYNDLNSNPAEANSFTVKFVFEKSENIQKEHGFSPFKKDYLIMGRRVQ